MRRRRWFEFRFRDRSASWVALFAQVIALVGLPTPVVVAKDRSAPFPCQSRACGCSNAGDCWRRCCCFSAPERVAWARARQIELPAELVDAAETESPECPSCAQCQSECRPPEAPDAPKPRPTRTWTLAIHAKQCRGTAHERDASPSIPPQPAPEWRFESVCADRAPEAPARAVARSDAPPAPPPRSR